MTRRRVRTRANLLDAAFAVFAAKGFGRVSIEEVCEAAGYSRGAFYSNFDSLDELFFALYRQRADLIAEQVAGALALDGPGPRRARRRRPGHRGAAARPGLAAGEDGLPGARRPRPGRRADPAGTPRRGCAGPSPTGSPGPRDSTPLPAVLGDVDGAAHAVIAAYDGVTTQLLLDKDVEHAPALAQATAHRAAHRRQRHHRAAHEEGTVAMDADVIVVGAGLAGLVAAHELTSRGKQGRAGRPGERRQPRRAGLLVVRRAVPRRLARSSGASASRTPSSSPGTTGRAAPSSTGSTTRTPGRCDGPAPTSSSRRARSGPGSPATASRFLPDGRLGRARRPARRRPRQLRAPLPRRLGHRHRRRRAVRPLAPSRPPRDGLLTFYHRHRVDELVVDGRRGRAACAARSCAEDDSPRGVAVQPRPRRRLRAHRPGRRSSPPAASAPTTTSCAGTGRSGSARRRAEMVTGVPAYVDGRMLDISAEAGRPAGQPRPHVALHRGPAELEPDLARPRHPHPARPVLDVVRRARPPAARPVPARLRHPRHPQVPAHHARTSPATTTPGSSSPRRSSRRSSRCRAPSRTPTSPPRTARAFLQGAGARQGRARPGGRRSCSNGADFVVADNLERARRRR